MTQEKIKRFFSRSWIVIALLCVILFFHYTGIAAPLENLFTRIIQPGQEPIYSAIQSNISDTEREQHLQDLSKQELITLASEYEEQVENLISENTQLRSLVEDADLLQEQIHFLEERSYNAVQAKIVSRSSESLSQTLIINRGSAHGIKEGYPVIIEDGILVGTVQRVQDYSSQILLITSFDSHVGAQIQNEQQSQGIISGEHNLSLRIDYVPQFDVLLPQAVVTTSGVNNNIPSGLIIGQIQEVINDPGSLFQYAIVQPLFTSPEVSLVSIILP